MPTVLSVPLDEATQTAETLTFLNMPLEMRELFYAEIIDWVGIELILHLDTWHYACRIAPYRDRRDRALLCVARRAPIETSFLSADAYSFEDFRDSTDEDTVDNFIGVGWMFTYGIPNGEELAHKLRYPTFLSFLNTCRQIRKEMSSFFWKRTEFNCGFLLERLMRGSHVPLHVTRLLQNPFAGGIISQNVRKLKFHFRRVEIAYDMQGDGLRLMEIDQSGTRLFELVNQFPNLTKVTFVIRDPEACLDYLYVVALSGFLAHLQTRTRPLSILFQGAREDTVRVWRDRLGPMIEIKVRENRDGDDLLPPVCCRELDHSNRGWHRSADLDEREWALANNIAPIGSQEMGRRLTEEEIWDRTIWTKALGLPEMEEFSAVVGLSDALLA